MKIIFSRMDLEPLKSLICKYLQFSLINLKSLQSNSTWYWMTRVGKSMGECSYNEYCIIIKKMTRITMVIMIK